MSGAGSTELGDTSWLASRVPPLVILMVGMALAFLVGAGAVLELKLALALVAAIAIAAVVMLRPFVGGVILIAVVPITSGLAVGVPVPYVRAAEVLIGLVGTVVLVTARRRTTVRWGMVDWLLLAFGLAWMSFGIADAAALHERLTLTDWGTIVGQLQFFLLYRAVRVTVVTTAQRRTALTALLVASLPVAVLAIAQQLRIGAVEHFIDTITASAPAPTWAGLQRATGPFDNWAALAGYLFPLLLVLVSLAVAGQIPPARKRLFLAVAVAGGIALALTAELSAIVCLLIAVVVLAVRGGRGRQLLKWLAIGATVAAVVVGPFLGTRLDSELSSSAGSGRSAGVPQTLAFRDNVWVTQYLPAIESRPMQGYGVVNPPTISWQFPESEYISLLMEGGLPLLLLFGGLTWAIADRARRAAASEDRFESALGSALFVTVIGVIAMNAIWPYMSNGGLPQVLWCLAAVALPQWVEAPAEERSFYSVDQREPRLAGSLSGVI